MQIFKIFWARNPPLQLCRTAPPERRKSAPGISDFPPPTFLQIENPA